MKTINLGAKKPIKVGNSYYISIPKAFIYYGLIDVNKSYQVLLNTLSIKNLRKK